MLFRFFFGITVMAGKLCVNSRRNKVNITDVFVNMTLKVPPINDHVTWYRSHGTSRWNASDVKTIPLLWRQQPSVCMYTNLSTLNPAAFHKLLWNVRIIIVFISNNLHLPCNVLHFCGPLLNRILILSRPLTQSCFWLMISEHILPNECVSNVATVAKCDVTIDQTYVNMHFTVCQM